MIDFELPPDIQQVQARVASFVKDVVLPAESEVLVADDSEVFDKVLGELRVAAKEAGLWTPHLPSEWGGLGLGPLGMAIVSQECGVSHLASLALNAMAPDEGNMHLLLHAADSEQKERYLRPLAAGEVRSCFAMTEQAAGSDPAGISTTAERHGDEWVLNGEKWFTSGAAGAAFAIVVAKTDLGSSARDAYSLFLVDEDNPS